MNVGAAWLHGDHRYKRGAIYAALKLDRGDPHAIYGTIPFRIMEEDGQHWIAGAVGIYPAFTTDDWSADDIDSVILWNPRTNALRLLGEAEKASAIVLPIERTLEPRDSVTIHADGFSFFRAWAEHRANTMATIRAARDSKTVLIPREPQDSDIPGALVIGDIDKIRWRDIGVPVLIAGPGVDATALNRAIYRSAALPRVQAAPDILRRAA